MNYAELAKKKERESKRIEMGTNMFFVFLVVR